MIRFDPFLKELLLALDDDSSKNVKGYYKNGSIFIVKNNIESVSDLNETLFHEAFHAGLRKAFGKDGRVNNYLSKTFDYFNNNNVLNDIKEKYELDFNNKKDRIVAAEEKLAEISQKGDSLPFKNQIMGNMAYDFQKLEKNKTFSEKDINAIIEKSLNQLKDLNALHSKRRKECNINNKLR